MAPPPPGPGQHQARLDRGGPHQRHQQPADLGHGQRQQAEPAAQAAMSPFARWGPLAWARVTARNACASSARVVWRYQPGHLRSVSGWGGACAVAGRAWHRRGLCPGRRARWAANGGSAGRPRAFGRAVCASVGLGVAGWLTGCMMRPSRGCAGGAVAGVVCRCLRRTIAPAAFMSIVAGGWMVGVPAPRSRRSRRWSATPLCWAQPRQRGRCLRQARLLLVKVQATDRPARRRNE